VYLGPRNAARIADHGWTTFRQDDMVVWSSAKRIPGYWSRD
jgi:hypothetical protein